MKHLNFKPQGVSGLRRYGPYIYEEFLPELRWPQAGKIYQEMSDNDAVIGAILYLAEMLIRGVEWRVEPAGASILVLSSSFSSNVPFSPVLISYFLKHICLY